MRRSSGATRSCAVRDFMSWSCGEGIMEQRYVKVGLALTVGKRAP